MLFTLLVDKQAVSVTKFINTSSVNLVTLFSFQVSQPSHIVFSFIIIHN